jgi:hypothetical protein
VTAQEGPPLESLTRRLAECPAEFLAEPRIGTKGEVRVAAVVADLLIDLGGRLPPDRAAEFDSHNARRDRNRLRVSLVACWMLHDPWFREQKRFGEPALDFLAGDLAELAGLIEAPRFVTDPDRREELARSCLKSLGLRPAGESPAQAQDRLATLNTAERQRVIKAAREVEARARQVREAMARQAAYDASLKSMRE